MHLTYVPRNPHKYNLLSTNSSLTGVSFRVYLSLCQSIYYIINYVTGLEPATYGVRPQTLPAELHTWYLRSFFNNREINSTNVSLIMWLIYLWLHIDYDSRGYTWSRCTHPQREIRSNRPSKFVELCQESNSGISLHTGRCHWLCYIAQINWTSPDYYHRTTPSKTGTCSLHYLVQIDLQRRVLTCNYSHFPPWREVY
jgi:hypothetical protein